MDANIAKLCGLCFKKGTERCARCQQRWYCSRYCQVKDWHLGHKGDCGLTDLPLPATIPAPPSRLIPGNVEIPVISEKEWKSLEEAEASNTGPRHGYPRGLRNLGNSCYMNSVLQSVFHAAPMLLASCRDHRAKVGCATPQEGLLKPGEGCFRCDLVAMAYKCLDPCPVPASTTEAETQEQLAWGDKVMLDNGSVGSVEKLVGGDKPYFEVRLDNGQKISVPPEHAKLCCRAATGPLEVARWLPRLGDEFTFGMQEDAHEYLRSLLRLLEHEELRECTGALRKRAAEGEIAEVASLPANADLTATPSRIFGGVLASQCTCTNRACAASSFSYENFMDLSLDITEATETLEDSLKLFTAPEKLDKKNAFRCETCQETVRPRKQLRIYSTPNCLVLHLKRFRYDQRGKVKQPVEFSAKLNMAPFLCPGAPEAGKPMWYDLRAVVVHVDKAGYSHFGHYIAFVRCSREAGGRGVGTGSWYVLDDSAVQEVSEDIVLRQEAYLLVYARASSSAEGVFQPPLRCGTCKDTRSTDSVPSPVMCRGLHGAVCSFFSCSDGLCTKCYMEEHGKPPPVPDPIDESPLPLPTPAVGNTTAAKSTAKPSSVQPVGKTKKVGANDPCPCGSGNKYKKCHGKK